MAKKKMIIGCSPLTGTLFGGTLLKDGKTWSADRQDVTDTAVGAVAQHLIHREEAFEFEMGGKKYRMEVKEIK
jgi:hypothetical protein